MRSYCETKRSSASGRREAFTCRHDFGASQRTPKRYAKGFATRTKHPSLGDFIELVAARPGTGSRRPSTGSLDRLVALSDVLIQRGHAADLEYLDLVYTNARMLASGRLGINDQAMRAAMNAFTPSLVAQRHEDAEELFQMRWREPSPGEGRSREIDEASRHEWRFSITEMAQVVGVAAGLSMDAGRPVIAFRREDAIRAIAAQSDLDAGVDARGARRIDPRRAARLSPLNPLSIAPTCTHGDLTGGYRYSESRSFAYLPRTARSSSLAGAPCSNASTTPWSL